MAHYSFLRHVTRSVKAPLLAAALAVGVVSTANAATITFRTDATWLATDLEPAAGWNTDPFFNTAGWTDAVVHCSDPVYGDCIWYDGQFSATASVWLRGRFTISSPITSAFLIGGIDDDGDIYVNGTLVYSDNNGFAQAFGPIDVTAYLVQGVNFIAVSATDNVPVFGQNHTYLSSLEVQTAEVPEPSSLLLLGSGVAALAFRRRRRQSKLSAVSPK
jgi:hypothetical protein